MLFAQDDRERAELSCDYLKSWKNWENSNQNQLILLNGCYLDSRGCQSLMKNYLMLNFLLSEIRLISQLKSDWSKYKKAIITVTSRIYCFWLSSKKKFSHNLHAANGA